MKKWLFAGLVLLCYFPVKGQNIGIGTVTPAASAQLDITSTSKGVLLPRMTKTQKNARTAVVFIIIPEQPGFGSNH
jgi:hypothetical protein